METPKRLAPKQDTLRELYLKTGNLCAFPGCDAVLMDEDGTFAAQICHIEAAEPGGERFNPNMTNEERRAFPNLILFCYRHHQVTNSVDRYDVLVIKEIKAAHERRFSRPDRPMLERIAKAKWYTLVGVGSTAALSIEGIARQLGLAFDALANPARRSDAEPKTLRTKLLDVLRYGPRGTVHYYSRDPQHLAFGKGLIEIFQASGWNARPLSASLFIESDTHFNLDESMWMAFSVRDPHQSSNADATVREFFTVCGFYFTDGLSIANGLERGRVLTFYTPVVAQNPDR